jgi:hypothetical protein
MPQKVLNLDDLGGISVKDDEWNEEDPVTGE